MNDARRTYTYDFLPATATAEDGAELDAAEGGALRAEIWDNTSTEIYRARRPGNGAIRRRWASAL